MHRCCLFFTILFSIWGSSAFAQPSADEVPAPSVNVSEYNWLHTELNMLQFYNRESLLNFYKKWKKTDKEKLSIVHFGDSHCQHDVLPGQMRKRLQEVHGDAGRGLMFSFSAAKTYSSVEYRTSHTGTWTSERSFTMLPKLPMGVRGMTARTQSAPASLSFQFTEAVPKEHTLLKIFCKKDVRSFDLIVEAGGEQIPVTIDASDKTPYVTVKIPEIKDRKLTLHVVRKNQHESEFEYYGMSLEAEVTHGVIYHNAGVGAARWNSLLYQELLWEQLPTLEPDVIVIDFGTNDYLYNDKIRPELEKEIKTIIKKIRETAPEASIILTSAQDLYWKKINCKSGEPFSDLMHRIAAETDCAIFDWYWISGAQGTMLDWVRKGLAQPDMVHLTVPGYRLKGNLFADAMANTVAWLDKNPEANEFYFNLDKLKEEQKTIRAKIPQSTAPAYTASARSSSGAATATKVVPASTEGRVKYVHNIKTGESLYSIGKKYHVTVSQIMSWNGMRSDKIYAGKPLIIYVKR